MQSPLQKSLRRSLSRAAAGCIALSLFLSPVIAGRDGPVRLTVRNPEPTALRWLLKGRRIQAMLKDGTYLKARVEKVEQDRLYLTVDDFEGPTVFVRDDQDVALSRFSTITVTRHDGCMRAVLGFTLGTLGIVAGVGLGTVREDKAGKGTAAAVVGLSAGSIVGGYLLGRHLDKKEITIIID